MVKELYGWDLTLAWLNAIEDLLNGGFLCPSCGGEVSGRMPVTHMRSCPALEDYRRDFRG